MLDKCFMILFNYVEQIREEQEMELLGYGLFFFLVVVVVVVPMMWR